ncbi:MAG TPA: hypothetical protein VGN26_02980, partial [Armatimonadota bacterium]
MSPSTTLHTLEIALRAAASLRRGQVSTAGPTDLYLCVADHFEPWHGRPPRDVALRRLREWAARYPGMAGFHHDCEGRPPAHTFFYPWDEYDPEEL